MTDHERRRDEKANLKMLRDYWPLIATIGMGIAFYATTTSRLSSADELHKTYSGQIREHETRLSRTEQAITAIPEMQRDIKEILRRVK